MVNVNTRKSAMTLLSLPNCVMSHGARFVLHEKGIAADIEYYDPHHLPEDLLELNPNGTSPTLIERDLVLYDARIIMEYLDERFPHPPLHQMDPVSRANTRMIIKRIDQDWYQLLDDALFAGEKKAAAAKKSLKKSLIEDATPVLKSKDYFMSDEFALIDCVMAPFLWRLPSIGIGLNSVSEELSHYANRLFSRKAFKASLSDIEKEMAELPK